MRNARVRKALILDRWVGWGGGGAEPDTAGPAHHPSFPRVAVHCIGSLQFPHCILQLHFLSHMHSLVPLSATSHLSQPDENGRQTKYHKTQWPSHRIVATQKSLAKRNGRRARMCAIPKYLTSRDHCGPRSGDFESSSEVGNLRKSQEVQRTLLFLKQS